MTNEELRNLQARFDKECTPMFLAHEYPGYTGEIKCMLLTDLTETELVMKYGALLEKYKPYQLERAALAEPVNDYNRNEDKYRKREIRTIISYDAFQDSDYWDKLGSLSNEDFQTAQFEEEFRNARVFAARKALNALTDVQRRRLCQYHLAHMSSYQIACNDGVDHRSVLESLAAAEKKFQKVFKNTLLNRPPLSILGEGDNQMSGAIASSILKN